MSGYIISPEASQDLDEISDYFLSRSLAAGEWVSGFRIVVLTGRGGFPDNRVLPRRWQSTRSLKNDQNLV